MTPSRWPAGWWPGRSSARKDRPVPAFVATTGGHLVQLSLLAPVVEPERHQDGIWITHRTPQSESMLAGKRVQFVPFIYSRQLGQVLSGTPRLVNLLRREGVDVAYSTGATIALAALPLAPLVGVKPVFVESLARADGPSLAGRVLQRLPWVRRYTQYPANAGPRWEHSFSILDTFALTDPAPATRPARVLVTVGTARPWGFERLLRRMQAILPTDAEVVWQTGASDVSELGLRGRILPIMSDEEFQVEIGRADVVVSHAGVGTFIRCLEAGKVPILASRRVAHDEHVDDHQLQIAGVAAQRGLALAREADEVTYEDLMAAASMRVEPITASPVRDLT